MTTTTTRTRWNETTVTARLVDLRTTPNGRVHHAITEPVSGVGGVQLWAIDEATAARLGEDFWATLENPVVTFTGRHLRCASSTETLDSNGWSF